MVNILIIIVAKYFYLISILIALIYFLQSKKTIKRNFLLFAIPSLVVSYVLAKVSSLLINDPRPFVVEHIKPLIAHAADNGFPSDHTLLTMTIASIIFAYNKKLGTVLFVIAGLVGAARIIAKIHHPLDIIGATVIAVGATAIVFLIEKKHFKKPRQI